MPRAIIVEPNISKEENEKNLEEVKRVLAKIAKEILQRVAEEGEEKVLPPGCGIRIIRD